MFKGTGDGCEAVLTYEDSETPAQSEDNIIIPAQAEVEIHGPKLQDYSKYREPILAFEDSQ